MSYYRKNKLSPKDIAKEVAIAELELAIMGLKWFKMGGEAGHEIYLEAERRVKQKAVDRRIQDGVRRILRGR